MAKRLRLRRDTQEVLPITSLGVSGFKAIDTEQQIQVRPLTILAGTNSSGKSSIMQAALLLKQTLEATFDPGPLLLNGPNVRFSDAGQMLFHCHGKGKAKRLTISIGLDGPDHCKLIFARGADTIEPKSNGHLGVTRCEIRLHDGGEFSLQPDTSEDDVVAMSPFAGRTAEQLGLPPRSRIRARVVRDRCFLKPEVEVQFASGERGPMLMLGVVDEFGLAIQRIIHLPGLRGNPERSYRLTAIGPEFPGTFENYTASIVAEWQRTNDARLERLNEDLAGLDLTWKIEAKNLDDTRVELRVGRLRRSVRGGAHDLVSIADVGFGVSQTLPVLVALEAALPGQLVYIEQPEIHLHPRAQVAMASVLARAAKRGVRVVAETHSAMLLLGVQAQVANGSLPPNDVKLHWFSRDDQTGATTVSSADLDRAGRFGDWPEDFDEVTLRAQADYLDVAESLMVAS